MLITVLDFFPVKLSATSISSLEVPEYSAIFVNKVTFVTTSVVSKRSSFF